ncbi:MAG: GAF domain-containing protein [Chloroflexota bacterium]|nr:GAF domain-containing protein [Chloroflexota bacterium]
MNTLKSQEESLSAGLEQIKSAYIDKDSLRQALERAVQQESSGPILAWAHVLGAHSAGENRTLQALVEATIEAADLVAVHAPAEVGEKVFTAQLVAAAAESYHYAVHLGELAGGSTERQLRDRVSELTALHRINSAANSSLKLNDLLNETAQAVVAVTHADRCTIFLYESEWDQLVLTATTAHNHEAVGTVRLRVGEGIAGWSAMLGKPVAVRDAWSDPRFKFIPALKEEKAASILAVPVVLFTKEKLVGVIAIHTFEERDFSEDEIKFLETVAGEMSIAIENARLYEQTDSRLQQKVAELSTLQGVSAHIAATLNLSEVLALIAYQSAHLVHADAAAIYEMHPDAGILELVAQYDLKDPKHNIHQGKNLSPITLPASGSLIAEGVMRGVPSALPPGADSSMGLPFASGDYSYMFCVPLVAPRGIMGGICLYNKEARTFSDEQVRLLDAFAHEAAIGLENSRLYDAALRGLKTKSAMLQEMNHRVRNNLQTVAGLLSMQLRRMPQESKAATAVRESIARIQSMAAVHDLMVRGDVDVQSTSIYDLARKVSDSVVSTLTKPGLKLELVVDSVEAGQIRVNSQEATLLALLFNEFVSNSILHGFEGLTSGEIHICANMVRNAGQPTVEITVEDNGTGLPPGFDPQKDANLGLNIVHTLVLSDLRGTFKIGPRTPAPGTTATIVFHPREE